MKSLIPLLCIALTGCVSYVGADNQLHHKVKGCLDCDYDQYGNRVSGHTMPMPYYVPPAQFHPTPVYQLPTTPAPTVVNVNPAPASTYVPIPSAARPTAPVQMPNIPQTVTQVRCDSGTTRVECFTQ